MRRPGFTIWEIVIVLATIGLLAMILIPVVNKNPDNSPRALCQSNLKQVGLGVLQYIQDYKGKYPLINVKDTAIDESNPLGWADAIYPYTKSQLIFWCPTQIRNGSRNRNEKKPSDRDYTDYFYNRQLAGIETKKVISPAATILLGEGNDGTDDANTRYSLSTLPTAWRADKMSPLYRHLDGANYAFADGHVKWMKPEKVSDKKTDASTSTFAIK